MSVWLQFLPFLVQFGGVLVPKLDIVFNEVGAGVGIARD